MPSKTKTTQEVQEVSKALPQDQPERFKLSETGYSGLNIFNGVTNDELKKELNWPQSIKTFKQMSYHSAIAAPLTLFENIIGKATYRVVPPANATEEEKQQAKVIAEMLDDMEHPFSDVIKDALTSNIYGFCVTEKVYRKRYFSNGSKYNDGLIAWKKLPIRNQETIEKFEFSQDGNEIIGVKQDLTNTYDPYNRFVSRANNTVILPRKKFLLFRHGRHKGDPFGKSMLRDAYLSWRYLSAIEELESNGVVKDLSGIPMLKLPAQMMAADASPEVKQTYEGYKNLIRNIQMNQQSGIILPQVFDPETRQPLFDFSLVSTDGKKNYDTTKIKDYYKNAIYTAFFADALILGQGSTGSFALSTSKMSLTMMAAEAMMRSIIDVLNNDLIRQTYELNGWDVSRTCKLDFENIDANDLETFSKAIQRITSVSAVEKDREFFNLVRTNLGLDPKPEDAPIDESALPEMTSRASDGMATAFEGTRTSMGEGNDNDNNMDNAA